MSPCRVPLVILLVLATMFAAAPAADAARWQHDTVTYRNSSKYDHAVKQAVRWINDLGSPLTLRHAGRRERADIVIRRVRLPDVVWAGRAAFPPFGEVELNASYLSDERVDAGERADVVVHELLHAVGVDHLSGCTVMNATQVLDRRRCNRDTPEGEVRCGPQRADAKAVVKLYGGRVGDFQGYRCELDDRSR